MDIEPFAIAGSTKGVLIACDILSIPSGNAPKSPPAVILFHHATGLLKEPYYPILERILSTDPSLVCLSFDARNHGDSALLNYTPEGKSRYELKPYDPLPANTPWVGKTTPRDPDPPNDAGYTWWYSAYDTLKVLEFVRKRFGESVRVYGLGHSFGAAVITAAEHLRPGSFKKLYLIEPIIMSPESIYGIDVMTNTDPKKYPHPDTATGFNFPLARAALKRRGVFANREEARENFLSKQFFREWDPRCLEIYVEEGLYEKSSGEVALKCHPLQEAATFAGAGIPRLFLALNSIKIPCKVITGSNSTFVTQSFHLDGETGEVLIKDEVIARRLDGIHEYIQDRGHMVPLEVPEEIADNIFKFFFGDAKL
ncbi:Alpha/Beta hydrolase protein [Cladochytrium replicatum]|nr:Alpha/Beta hydrolase protein [Cladochytrium replicatum]